MLQNKLVFKGCCKENNYLFHISQWYNPNSAFCVAHTREASFKQVNKDWNRFSPPNTLDLLSPITWIWVSTFQKSQLRQLRQWVFFGTIWPLHLGTLRKLHTKHWFALSSSMQHLFGIPIMNLRLDRWRRCRGQLPGGPAGDGGTPVASAICLTNLSGHPWRPAGSSPP